MSIKPEFKKFNSLENGYRENGWGSYYSLKEFVEQYLIACCTYPNARIKICR